MEIIKKSRLLFIPYTFTNGGGAEKILQLLVNNLPPEKYNVVIQEVEQYNKFLELRNGVKLNQAFLNQTYPDKFYNDLNYILLLHYPKLLKYVFRLNGYDAVITYNYQLPSFMLPAFNSAKKIAWFHGDLYDLNDADKSWEKKKQKAVWKNADKIVTISNKSQKSLSDIFPEYVSKNIIIHNGTDVFKIIDQGREAIELPFKDIPFAVCVGRLDENKNYTLAVKAIAKLNKKGINCGLVFVGEGKLKTALQEEAGTLGVSSLIQFAGFQTNPYKYISKAKILCVTSFSEGWPTVVMETMALGIPFVTTPVAGASEELAAGGQCGLVATYDAKAYAEKIEKLLTDEELYKKMSKNCLEHVKEYSAEKYVENFEKLLKEIGVDNENTEKAQEKFLLLKSTAAYLLYFILSVFSAGEIIFRIQIICKRIKEKRFLKIIKNIIYLFGIIMLLPFSFIFKVLYFPFYIRKIVNKGGK